MATDITCEHCSYNWEYKGEMKVMATCPSCSLKTHIHPKDESDIV